VARYRRDLLLQHIITKYRIPALKIFDVKVFGQRCPNGDHISKILLRDFSGFPRLVDGFYLRIDDTRGLPQG
jgi:hypothetical protein